MSKNEDKFKCSVCGELNNPENDFCKRCFSPVNIKKLSDINKEELDFCISSLLNHITDKKLKHIKEKKRISVSPFFKKYLNVYWARPENAMWRTIEAEIISKFRETYLPYPMLDLGCGDGINISILFGYEFGRNFDMFKSVDFSKIDIYDCYRKGELGVEIITKGDKIGIGIDIKKSLVNRAQELGTYDRIVECDVRKMLLNDKTFNSIYSNVIKDFNDNDVNLVLREAHRVLNDGGYLVLTTPNEKHNKFLYFYPLYEENKGKDRDFAEMCKTLDRGRSTYSVQQKTKEEWGIQLRKNGFKLVECFYYANKDVMKLWDIGFRPFSPFLINLANSLDKLELRIKFKNKIISLTEEHLSIFLDEYETDEKNGAYMILVAKKI